MFEDSIHGLPRPVDDGEHTIGQSRFGEKLAHHKGRHPTRKLDDLYAAPDLPCGVCCVLAVLESDQVPQLLEILLKERLEGEEDPRPRDDRGGSPGRERFPCLPYGAVDVISCREGCLCDDLSCSRIIDGFRVTSVSLLPPSPYKIPDLQAFLARLHLVLLTGRAC